VLFLLQFVWVLYFYSYREIIAALEENEYTGAKLLKIYDN